MEITQTGNMLFLSDGIGINRCTVKGQRVNYSEHYHNFIEIVYMLKGHCIHIVDGIEYPTKSGDMVIINYGQSHKISGRTDVEYVNIYMKPEYINKALADKENAFALLNLNEFEDFKKIIHRERSHISFKAAERRKIETLIFLLLDDIETHQGGSELACRSEINLILITLFRKLSVPFCESPDGINENLLSYIKKHSDENLTLDQLAKKCSYNKFYFSRMFKEYTGVTFVEYLRNVRIKKAALLLRETNMSIEDIITSSGCSDKTKFFKHFKSIYNKTPLQYRKSHKSKK